MPGKIEVDIERCKGCGLCVDTCPHDCITISTSESNKKGYFPAVQDNTHCTGCTMCAVICPDAAITVFREMGIRDVKPTRPKAKRLVKEKL